MRVINLTHGAGNGIDTACLMTASNMLIGRGEDGDNNSCVCSLLRLFIVLTNNPMPLPLLRELYGPLAWEILGTRNDDPAVMRARACAFADWSVREIAPLTLESIGLSAEADKLRSLSEIVDDQSARAAADAARAAADAADAADADDAADDADYAARAAADAADADDADDAADDAARAARAAADAARSANAWRKCPEIIRRVSAIGDKRPVECVIDAEQLARALEGAI